MTTAATVGLSLAAFNKEKQGQSGREITFALESTKNGGIPTARVRQVAAAMTSFSRIYEADTAREDTVIVPAFKAALPEQRLEELSDGFQNIERQQFGGDGFEMAVQRIIDIERRLGIADLAAFTAPSVPAT